MVSTSFPVYIILGCINQAAKKKKTVNYADSGTGAIRVFRTNLEAYDSLGHFTIHSHRSSLSFHYHVAK